MPLTVAQKNQLLADIAALQNDVNALVPDVPAPTISNFTVVPSTLPFGGGNVTVTANVTDATTITLNGAPITLPATISIVSTTNFFLTAHGQTAPDATSGPVTVTVAAQAVAKWTKISGSYKVGDPKGGPWLNQGWWRAAVSKITGDIFIAEGAPTDIGAPAGTPCGGVFWFRSQLGYFERINTVVSNWHKNIQKRENYGADHDPDRNVIYFTVGGPVGYTPSGLPSTASPQYGDMVYDIANDLFSTPYAVAGNTYVPIAGAPPAGDDGTFGNGVGGGPALGGFDCVLVYDQNQLYRFGSYSIGVAQQMSKRDLTTGAITVLHPYTQCPTWTSQPARGSGWLRGGMNHTTKMFWAIGDNCEVWTMPLGGSWTKVGPVTSSTPVTPSPYPTTNTANWAPDWGIIAACDEKNNRLVVWAGKAATVQADNGIKVQQTWFFDLAKNMWTVGPSLANGDVVPTPVETAAQNMMWDPVFQRVLLLVWNGSLGTAEVWSFS
jgi:hypothetical protein